MVCGEASGDLNASLLARALRERTQSLEISAVGGMLLRRAGASIFYDIKDLSVMGFFDVLIKLPKFLKLKRLILRKIAHEKPDAIILIDFSGFNLRLAKAINKSIPVIYYISPQVWASRSSRIDTIRKYVSKMIVLFKFEQEFYKSQGIDVDFLGHPLLDSVKPSMNRKEFISTFGLLESKNTIALLPGSRRQEITHLLPTMLEVSKRIQCTMPATQFIIAKSPHVNLDVYYKEIRKSGLEVKIIEDKTYDCLYASDFCVVCSGTATLETAIMQRPFCVMYKMTALNYVVYRPQIKVPFIGMVNIVAGRKIVPELIQFQATPQKISEQVLNILKNPQELQRMKSDFAQVKSSLGEKGASLRAAQIVVDFLKK